MTCGLSGNALVPSEPLYTELVCTRRQPPPFPHLARAESLCGPFLPKRPCQHESAELFLQASLQSKVVTVMKEKCSEAREGGSANSAAKKRPCSTTFRRVSPSAICTPNSLNDFSAHREHGRITNAQKAVGSLYLVLLLSSGELSIFDRRKPQVSSAEFTSPILLATVCSHSSAVPNSSKLFSKTSSAKSVTPHERSTSSYGLRRKIPPLFSGDRRLPRVNRTLKNRTKLVWNVFVTHEQTDLRKTTRNSVWSQHFCAQVALAM